MTLSEAVEAYITRKKSEGYAFTEGAFCLRKFSSQTGDVSLGEVSSLSIAQFLDDCSGTNRSWGVNRSLLRPFFDYWVARTEMAPLPLPPKRRNTESPFIPYVYSPAEICGLLHAIIPCLSNQRSAIKPEVFRMVFVLLFATGATSGEIRRLRQRDVCFKTRTIILRNTRLGDRRTPVGRDLLARIKNYLSWRFHSPSPEDLLFPTKSGTEIDRSQLSRSFSRLCRHAGVVRRDGFPGSPHIRDLRTSFAVGRVTDWIKNGENLNVLLPALAAYLGRSSLLAGDEYLRMTPERFRNQLDALSPRKGRLSLDDPLFLAALARNQPT